MGKTTILTLAALLLSAIGGKASTITYMVTGEAQATITTGTNSITITLQDLFVNPTSVADNLSAFNFTLSSAPTSASIASSSAQLITVAGPGYTTGATVAPGWALSIVGASTSLDDLAAGGAGPAHTIIGAPGSGGYTAANGSIAGNGPHNPFLNQTASWTLTENGVTAATTVTATTFQFGTTDGSGIVPGTVEATPEPSTISMFIGGLFLLAASLKRKRA